MNWNLPKKPVVRWSVSYAAACLVALLGAPVSAALFVYEPFDYADGSNILGQSGGLGFTGAWREHSSGSVPAGSFVAAAASLAGPAGLPTSGGHAVLTGEFGTLQPARDFDNIVGGDGTTTWISFLGQRQGEAQIPPVEGTNPYPRGVNASFFDSEHPTRPERIAIGNSSGATENEWSIVREGSGSQRTGTGVPYETLAWAVMRIDHHGDETVPDDAYLWINPDPLGGEPTLASADAASVGATDYANMDFVRPFVGNAGSGRPAGKLVLDELRIGDTWASMSAVPEPATAALVALAGLALLAPVRRR